MATRGTAGFNNVSISFKGNTDPLENVFGPEPMRPPEMTKKLWAYVKEKRLASNPPMPSDGGAADRVE